MKQTIQTNADCAELLDAASAAIGLLYQYMGYSEVLREIGRGFSGTDNIGSYPEDSTKRLQSAIDRFQKGREYMPNGSQQAIPDSESESESNTKDCKSGRCLYCQLRQFDSGQ